MDPGDAVEVRFTKWGGLPHWEATATLLGTDAHGRWLGAPAGTVFERPGVRVVLDQDAVMLVPDDDGFVASFYAPGGSSWCQTYVDITTVPVVGPGGPGGPVCAVDLDLDVVRTWDGEVLVDDEDEFELHRDLLGYPDHLVAHARASCEAVLAAVTAGLPPYDGTATSWLDRVAAP